MAAISHQDMLEMKRWNTPTIYNGWERITARNHATECFNIEEARDYMPHMGPMVGRAVTVVIEPSNPDHRKENPDGWAQYREYVAGIQGPKIVVVQDLDEPEPVGAFWGEVNSNVHRALGCVGTITDGAIRDTDEMNNAGFKALARRLCVGHANNHPVRWDCDVVAFGCPISPGQLIHADKHGFLVIPEEDEERLLEAALFMDSNECLTVISAARSSAGRAMSEILTEVNNAAAKFAARAKEFFKTGE